MKITTDSYVTIEYEFSDSQGKVLGSSAYNGPYSFQKGSGDALPGLDKFMEGKHPGDSFSFTIPPEEAYGIRDEDLVHSLPRSSFSQELQLAAGVRVSINGKISTITALQDSTVTLDSNHPLAGIPLHFNVKILSVSERAPEISSSCACGNTCGCHEQ